MKPFFEPSDFNEACQEDSSQVYADIANAKLEREAKVVYSGPSYNNHWIDCETMNTTHTALLINVQEIKDQQRETIEQEKSDILAIVEKIKKLYGNSMIGSEQLIEEIKKYWMSKAKKCEHPAEKVQAHITEYTVGGTIKSQLFRCECGAKVKPNSFEEIT